MEIVDPPPLAFTMSFSQWHSGVRPDVLQTWSCVLRDVHLPFRKRRGQAGRKIEGRHWGTSTVENTLSQTLLCLLPCRSIVTYCSRKAIKLLATPVICFCLSCVLWPVGLQSFPQMPKSAPSSNFPWAGSWTKFSHCCEVLWSNQWPGEPLRWTWDRGNLGRAQSSESPLPEASEKGEECLSKSTRTKWQPFTSKIRILMIIGTFKQNSSLPQCKAHTSLSPWGS